jgi:hypothetical protein
MSDQAKAFKLYTDVHIHKAVTTQLQLRGVDIIRCQDVGMQYAKDQEHLDYATREGRAIVAGDDDFLKLDAQWKDRGQEHAGIFYVEPAIRHLDRAVGILVRALWFYHEAVSEGAATVEEVVYNQVNYITLREWG